jgi:hypothetical protein
MGLDLLAIENASNIHLEVSTNPEQVQWPD